MALYTVSITLYVDAESQEDAEKIANDIDVTGTYKGNYILHDSMSVEVEYESEQ